MQHIKEELPAETPLAFGMHTNAEIDFRTTQCNQLFALLVELSPKKVGGDDENAATPDSKFDEVDIRLANDINLDQAKISLDDVKGKIGEDGGEMKPYQGVFMQEIEAMNLLVDAISKSVEDIKLAKKGELTMTESMEHLM